MGGLSSELSWQTSQAPVLMALDAHNEDSRSKSCPPPVNVKADAQDDLLHHRVQDVLSGLLQQGRVLDKVTLA